MQSIATFPKQLFRHFPIYRLSLQAVLLVCFLLSTSVLIQKTEQIQHSCQPMIQWTDKLPPACTKPDSEKSCVSNSDCPKQPPPPSNLSATTKQKNHQTNSNVALPPHPNDLSATTGQKKLLDESKCCHKPKPSIIPDVIGITAGAVAATGLAVVGTPVAAVLGGGFAIWLAVRTVLS